MFVKKVQASERIILAFRVELRCLETHRNGGEVLNVNEALDDCHWNDVKDEQQDVEYPHEESSKGLLPQPLPQ